MLMHYLFTAYICFKVEWICLCTINITNMMTASFFFVTSINKSYVLTMLQKLRTNYWPCGKVIYRALNLTLTSIWSKSYKIHSLLSNLKNMKKHYHTKLMLKVKNKLKWRDALYDVLLVNSITGFYTVE